jgi:hypothetical protein
MGSVKVRTRERPYLVYFPATGAHWRLTREQVDRAIAEYPLVRASEFRVVLRVARRVLAMISAATPPRDGPGFEVERPQEERVSRRLITREEAEDMVHAHAEGRHAEPQEGCPTCEDRPLRFYPPRMGRGELADEGGGECR